MSERYRIMIKATKDIKDSEEIIINYRKDYLVEKCLYGSHAK